MNGRRRRFLLGTVLAIQSSGFTYPACQDCCSRLILTSCRYECHKCGASYKDASHRYKLCVKVSEEQALHVITIFGKCLEKIFGASADSLHSHLQVSSERCRDLGHDRAQELLFHAAERCLIGRSFVFAVKVPENYDRSDSLSRRNLVACQIIHLLEDPMSCTVLGCFDQMIASVMSNKATRTKINVSIDSTNKDLSDLGFSEGSTSLHQSRDQYDNYWQQSLGLLCSPLSNTSAESQVNTRKGECSTEEQESHLTSPNTTVCRQKHLSSTPRVNCSSFKYIHPIVRSPPSSLRFPSKSETVLGQESYLQKSGSCRSQSCSVNATQLPPQTAEIHQAKEEIWEEFPFSESLSEFIAKIEDDQSLRPHSAATVSRERKRSTCSSMNDPGPPSIQNVTVVNDAPYCDFDKSMDNDSSAVLNKMPSSDDTGLADWTFPSAALSSCQKSFDNLPRNRMQDRLSPTYLKGPSYKDDVLGMCSYIKDLRRYTMPLSSRRDHVVVDEEPKSSDVEGSKARSTMTSDPYNASADLFEASNNPEDGGSSLSQRIRSPNRGQGSLMVPLIRSPCSNILSYRQSISLTDDYQMWSNMNIPPYLQSTPVLKRLSGTCTLTDPWHVNMAKSSINTKSRNSVRLLKNTRQRRSAMFYRLSENYSPWSPYLSPLSTSEGSTLLIPRNRTMTSSLKSWMRRTILEKMENFDNQTQDQLGDPSFTDCRDIGEEASIKCSGDNQENLSHGNRPYQEDEDQRSSGQEHLLSSDWSPELFSGKSSISQPNDCLQRRLF